MISVNTQTDELYTSYYSPIGIDVINVEEAKKIFEKYKEQKIVINCLFEDETWYMTDELHIQKLSFAINEFSYNSYYRKVLNATSQEYVLRVKIYLIQLFGTLSISTMQEIVTSLFALAEINPNNFYSAENILHHNNLINQSYHIQNFLLSFASDSYDYNKLINFFAIAADEDSSESSSSQRTLATFDSYFLFNDILTNYWNSSISTTERTYYYPLIIWWKITSVIPMRYCEIIVTPRDCLQQKDGSYYLTIRRNRIKGNGRKKTYKINGDYIKMTYQISEKLYQDIMDYISQTKEFVPNQINTLFRIPCQKGCSHDYYSANRLSIALHNFYENIISKKYGYNVIPKGNTHHLHDGEIEFIHLADTRHISMINIIASNLSPVVAMVLANHESIDMSAHYFSNITQLIECDIYRAYKNSHPQKGINITSSTLSLSQGFSGERTELKDGYCYSLKYAHHDYSDCLSAVDEKNRIMCCLVCPFYVPWSQSQLSLQTVFTDNEEIEQKFQCNGKILIEMINSYRKSKGSPVDILKVIMQLETDIHSYREFCLTRYQHSIMKGDDQ